MTVAPLTSRSAGYRQLSAYGAVLSAGAVAGLIVGGLVVSANLFSATWRPVPRQRPDRDRCRALRPATGAR